MSEHRRGKHEDHETGAQAGANGQTTADGQANGQAGADGQASADAQQPGAETQSAAGPQDELGAMRDRHLRLAAEFDNYRKRVERERGESWVRAQAQLAEKLLEPLDDLQRIADFDPATTSATALHEGAEMVEKKFLRALEAAGLELIDAAGKPFDPTVHEAITTGPTSVREEDDTVGDVFQKGYRFKGVLLRPARVRVRKHEG